MRSYWALVNQVSPYYCIQPHLQPFRELLKKNVSFMVTEILKISSREQHSRYSGVPPITPWEAMLKQTCATRNFETSSQSRSDGGFKRCRKPMLFLV